MNLTDIRSKLLFLLSSMPEFVNGQNIIVMGSHYIDSSVLEYR
jgi:hypothetical protein